MCLFINTRTAVSTKLHGHYCCGNGSASENNSVFVFSEITPYKKKDMKRIKTNSGVTGWQAKLQKAYSSFEEFAAYCETYGINKRLGFKSVKACWDKNPTIAGSVIPGGLRRVK